MWSIVFSGTKLAGIGASVGGVGWLLAMPRLTALLGSFEGAGARPPLMVVGAVIAVSVVACAIPASRSAKVDPADTLRAEGG